MFFTRSNLSSCRVLSKNLKMTSNILISILYNNQSTIKITNDTKISDKTKDMIIHYHSIQ
jgi:phage antirepressor YoqD-like protein